MSAVEKKSGDKVSEKSTKQELWQAYNTLLSKVQEEPIGFPVKQKERDEEETLKSLSELKLKVSRDIDKIGEEFLKDLKDTRDFKNSLAKNKQLMINNFSEQQSVLEKEMKKLKEFYEEEKKNLNLKLDEEISEKTVARERENEKYQYDLSLKRRNEEDEYRRIRQVKELQLQEKIQNIDAREKEKKEMEKEIAGMPEKISQAITEANAKLGKELTDKSEREKRENKITYENDIRIKELKISNLENTVKSQNAEIENFKRQLTEANKQLKEIAVSVIEGRGSINQPPAVDKS